MSTFKPKDDTSKFSVVNIIVPFSREEASGVECDRMHAIIMFLSNDYSKSIT